MVSFLGIIGYLANVALAGVWSFMATAWAGYWLPPTVGAFLGWFRNGKYPAMKRVWIALIDALAAVAIAFVLVFAVKFVIAFRTFWNPQPAIAYSFPTPAPPAPTGASSRQSVQTEDKLKSLQQRTNLLVY